MTRVLATRALVAAASHAFSTSSGPRSTLWPLPDDDMTGLHESMQALAARSPLTALLGLGDTPNFRFTGPMLAVQPTVELAKRFSRQRIEPLIAESPALRERAVEPISLTQEAALGQHHQQGHRHPHHGEQDVERQRHRHLRTGGEEVGHGGLLGGAWTAPVEAALRPAAAV